MDIDKQKLKYICEKCNYMTNYKSLWRKHINTELHITGKKKKRSDYKEPDKCNKCDYKTKNKTTMKYHILNEHSDFETRQKEFTYFCKDCDIGAFTLSIMEAHYKTNKHKKHILRNKMKSK